MAVPVYVMDQVGRKVVVALDTMGGDRAPDEILLGASVYLRQNPSSVFFRLFGNSPSIERCLSSKANVHLLENCEVIHADDVVMSDDKPSSAVRKKGSSMYKAVQDVREKASQCVVSAGNTGAFMGISKILLGMLENIYRPAIVTTLPTKKGEVVVLDLGANLDCSSDVLYQFAFMGSAFAKASLGVKNPRVALLNVGVEENKGTDAVKEAFHLLNERTDEDFTFIGYAEPSDVLGGNVDVVVSDGFTGNVMLKTAESIFHLLRDSIVSATRTSLLSRLAGLVLAKSLKKSISRFNPDLRNGAMLIGVNGVAVKAHGSSDSIAFANAIGAAVKLVTNNLNSRIIDSICTID
ncbi:fatty acid/phospholipid synthesis protein PlsX [Neorickettsia risticii str. Illinois]|uniref:Phosphate acyltransferase n=1 Tax=Neorickettsia risticii (strain Illinois) TaxID=434131 RepID=C6V5B3_NEORI|nr:phosphate acyltransferase PlsX [Neorickettsia risticii]ACT69532.1 fatty acid/phospholipid synthesis protein PlsX [Neorickettsia risticii str. Illinois]